MNLTQSCRWHLFPDADTLCMRVAEEIGLVSAEAISRSGKFVLVLAGGNSPRAVYRRLRLLHTDWGAWHIYFGDERCLPPDHPDRNSVMAEQAWLDHVPIPAAQIHRIPAQLGAGAAAMQYAKVLESVADFDLVLLGLGQDGHTASLFPGQDWGQTPDHATVQAVHHAPKPPSERVSLSAWRLGRAARVWFLVTGEDKISAVQAWQNGADIPAAAIVSGNGVDVWLAGVSL